MPTEIKKCFRSDLIVTSVHNQDTQTKGYLVKEPNSGETFEFGEEEYFLCQSLQQGLTAATILTTFYDRFKISLTATDLDQFIDQLDGLGLMINPDQVNPALANAVDHLHYSVDGNSTDRDYGSYGDLLEETIPDTAMVASKETGSEGGKSVLSRSGKHYLWAPKDPVQFFQRLSIATQWLVWPTRLVLFGLIPAFPITLYLFLQNQDLFWRDMGRFVNPLPFFLAYVFNIVVANLVSKVLQGIVATAYGAEIREFGFTLALGFYPRFSLGRKQVLALPRPVQLWVFGVPLLVRLVLFVIGMMGWFVNRHTGTNLDIWALLMAHSAILTFVFIACPFWPVDGYYWMVNALQLPRNLLGRTFTLWSLLLQGRRIPSSISWKERFGLLLFGLLAIAFMVFAIGGIARNFSAGLSSTFPNIFGRSTEAIFLTGLLLIVLLQLTRRWWQPLFKRPGTHPRPQTRPSFGYRSLPQQLRHGTSIGLRLALLFGLGLLMVMPYHSRPGGTIDLLPPTQQEVQAKVDGVITRVMFKGGDGQWITAGRVIAVMEAADIENDSLTRNQQIQSQQSVVASQQALLNKLLNTPRPEEVAVAQQNVEVARRDLDTAQQDINVAQQEVGVARQAVNTSASRADFSRREANRYQNLLAQGAISQQDYEDKLRRADLDQSTLEEKRQTLKVKESDVQTARSTFARKQQQLTEAEAQLQLVREGPHPDDIQAARDNLAAAQGELRRLQQELQYDQDQLQRTRLHMPMDGRLVTPYLDRQVGRFLKEGETFAVAEDDRNIFGELLIPEENTEDILIGADVEVKLLAYPDQALIGSVVSIDPKADDAAKVPGSTTPTDQRVVRVIVDMPDTDLPLKAGMTGYAKTDGPTMPLIVAFTRPVIRFFQIEFWSWLP